MISLAVYIIVGLILFFILYLAIQGIDRGVKAKNLNKSKNLYVDKMLSKNIAEELNKLKVLYKNGTINKKEFQAAKKKILS
tara:strand:+ start:8048 stop:8290 length:243 start_codon:yes stop_codon:yes gene_type:complete